MSPADLLSPTLVLCDPADSAPASSSYDTSNPVPDLLTLDHLGLVVPDIATGRDFLAGALGIHCWTPVTDDPTLGVSVQFGAAAPGALTYELIAPLGDTSPIRNALRSGKHILNHLAFLTADLDAAGARLRDHGCYPAGDPQPALAYNGKRVQFWMSPLRFVLELIEKPGHRHAFDPPASRPSPIGAKPR